MRDSSLKRVSGPASTVFASCCGNEATISARFAGLVRSSFAYSTFACVLLSVLSPLAVAQNDATGGFNGISVHLDNRRFVGPMSVSGESTPTQDIFLFKDGTFVSENCLRWGFSPTPYWLRRDADGLHFMAHLESPEHGSMHYEGTFDGRVIKGTAMWKKERWYWTIEREYQFMGRPSPVGK